MKNERKRSLIWSAFVGVALGALTAQAQTNFYWTNLVDGAWDATGNWTNAIPAAGGGTNYVLNFLTPATTVSTTNTLGVGGTTNGFLLNSLNVSNVALTIWGSNLVFITGGTTLPTFNQNGASSVVFNVGLVLSNDTTFGGSGSGAVLINSNVTGSGQFLKSGSNTLTLAGVNSYTNNTVISNGTLAVTNGGWINSPLATLNVLKGSNALSGGTIIVRTLLVTNNTLTATNAFFGFNSGTLTTSNANGLAANILLASNTSWNINGNWTMNGGTNRIVSVQTNGSWNNVYIGNSVSNAAVYVNSNAVWSLGTNATGVTSGTNNLNLYVGNNAGGSNNTLQINGGLVTNVYQVFLGGTAAGASGNQLIITNGGRLYIGNAAVSSASGTIGASANSNSVVIAGTNSAGGKATWDLGGSRLVVGANGYTGNWIRVDQGGLITNFVLMSYGVGSSVIITNGGLAVSSTGAGYTYVGRGGSISNSLIVAGADGSGTKATLNNNGVGFNIAGNGNA
ncbi:MAG: autotransporter-associated beta strand repeat-containing protein, partial [Kiritimatiellaeota bacterium]|nr:autotransporter-associated beta strand repeat-containing protein [Kiritimatiellota bacterium]